VSNSLSQVSIVTLGEIFDPHRRLPSGMKPFLKMPTPIFSLCDGHEFVGIDLQRRPVALLPSTLFAALKGLRALSLISTFPFSVRDRNSG